MALIKKSELKQMKEPEVRAKLLDLRKELIKIRSQIAMGTTPENPGKIKEIKRTIATLLNLLNKTKEVIKKDERNMPEVRAK